MVRNVLCTTEHLPNAIPQCRRTGMRLEEIVDCLSDAFERKVGTASFETCFEAKVSDVYEFATLLVLDMGIGESG